MNGTDAWRAVAELAAGQHGAFNRKQATKLGVTARRLKAATTQGTVWKPLSDVFVYASHAATFRQRCSVASLAGAVVSHRAAAILHGFDGFIERPSSQVEVCFERDHERQLPSVQRHTWSYSDTNDVTVVDGIRCTSIARTLFQLGVVCDRDTVEVALDSALRQGATAAWIEETALRLKRPGPTGGGLLFDIMYDPARTGELSESLLERVIERVLAIPGLPRPIRQFQVDTSDGQKRLDLAFPDVLLGIEGHSKRHHSGPVKGETDNLRDLQLVAAGWEVIYVSWRLAHDPETLVPLITEAYERRRRLMRLPS